jgi:hypothetical protein
MPLLTPERRAKLIADSKDAAAALLEDIRYLREVVASLPPKRGELRRVSGIIRRLLIDGDLKSVAAPRLTPFLLREPNNKFTYKQLEHNPNGFFGSGGVKLPMGIEVGGLILVFGTLTPPPPSISGHDANFVEVRVDNFLSQRILYFSGKWASRGAVIKYVANVASGVHSSIARTSDEQLTEQIRRMIYYIFSPTAITVHFRSQFFTLEFGEFQYDEHGVDPTLIEMYAAAHLLTTSPSVEQLEKIVAAELSLQR